MEGVLCSHLPCHYRPAGNKASTTPVVVSTVNGKSIKKSFNSENFAQEMSIVISGYGGYVFKYEGDAVISLFPAEYDNMKACKNASSC